MPIPWKELQAARKVIKLARKEKRKAERKAIRTERRRKAEESSKSRRRTSSSSESSTSSSSSALSSSPPRKRSKRSVTPQAKETAVGEPQRPQQSQTRDTAVGEPGRPQQPKSPEVKVVATKPAPRRERQVELSRAKETATIPPLPQRPSTPPPPPQQKRPAAKAEPLGEKREAANKHESSNEGSFPAVNIQGRIKKGIKVKIPVENRRPARERLGSPVHRKREEVVEKLRELASAGSSSAEAKGAEATSPPPRGPEANRHRRTSKEYPSVLDQEAYAVIPVHLDDFKIINEVVERMQILRHPTLRKEIITLRNVFLRRLNDQALGPEAVEVVQTYCRERK